jgi:peptide/nickel transport system substrate-binding protein
VPAGNNVGVDDSGSLGGNNVQDTTTRHRAPMLFLALLVMVALVAAACGSSSGSKGSPTTPTKSGSLPDESGLKPVSGGTITYGLEGKTTAFCPPRGQWAISGIMVASAVYDTLTQPTDDPNVYAPYLAKSVTGSPDSKTWTIVLRSGIKFHDGEPLNAVAVKQNIDAWRKGILLGFVFKNVANVVTLGEDTVIVQMTDPWVAFPAYLWTSGRAAIAAPAQINDDANCDTKMIGTGPFKLAPGGFDPTTGDVKVVKNTSYWRKGFPYLDGINFKPQEDSSQRIRGLQGGQFDITHDAGGLDLSEITSTMPSAVIWNEPNGRMEVAHTLLNVTRAPMDDLTARKAVALAVDRNRLNQISNKGTSRLADQIFDDDVMGHVDGLKYPAQNIEEAKKLVKQYKDAHGGKFEFAIQSTFDTTTQQIFREVKRELGQVGITVNLPSPVDQATIINQAIGGAVDAFGWRNYPGQDPDTLYVWFYGGSVVNFNHVNDPQLNADLDKGRQSSDTATRTAAYEDFNKRMTGQLYNFWTWYNQWFIATQSTVHGVVGPNLPDDNGDVGTVKPVPILAGIHQTVGLWKSK